MHRSNVLAIPLLLFTLYATSAQAQVCTFATATPLSDLVSGGGGNGGGGSGGSGGGGSSNSDWLDALSDSGNAATNGAADLITSSTTKLRKRETLTCTAAETCAGAETSLFCVNTQTGYFHAIGLTGNLITGDIELADGQKGNLFTGPIPTPSAAVGASSTATAAVANQTPTGGAIGTKAGSGSSVAAIVLGMLLL